MSAVWFYKGAVGHRRFGKIKHRLHYKIAYILIDLDRLDEAKTQSRLFNVNGRAPLSFLESDHGIKGDLDGPSYSLSAWVRGYLREHNVTQAAARIELLCLPRMFGFVFNPISVFFIYDEADQIHHVIYQVNNTFGDRVFYLCKAEKNKNFFRHRCDKSLYVSPFYDVEGSYYFTLNAPSETIKLNILYTANDEKRSLFAHLSGDRSHVNTKNAAGILGTLPLMTLGVVLGIHWEAVKLYVKGVAFRPQRTAYASDVNREQLKRTRKERYL